MNMVHTRRQQVFPLLSAAQIAVIRGFASSAPRRFAPNKAWCSVGARLAPVFVVIGGEALISEGAGSVIAGRPGQPALVRLEGFLAINGSPYTVLDVADHGEGQALAERFGLQEEDLPIVLCANGALLRHPSEAEPGACVDITPELDSSRIFDVAVVGAGPAGLTAAVYAGSEGLSGLVLDARSFVGQAGASARIENHLGFPIGISGHALAARACTQAQKFGAAIAIPVRVNSLDCGDPKRSSGEPFLLRWTTDRTCVRAPW